MSHRRRRRRRVRRNPASAWADAFNPLSFKPTWQKAVVGVGLFALWRALTAPKSVAALPGVAVDPSVQPVGGWR